jgi:hypothetical protein
MMHNLTFQIRNETITYYQNLILGKKSRVMMVLQQSTDQEK